MLKKVIDYENMTEKELNDLAVRYLRNTIELDEFCDTMSPIVYEKLNEWMEKKPQGYLEAVFQLAESPEFIKLSKLDYTMFIFMKMCRASEMEREQHLEPVITKFCSLEEMRRIYQLSVFYLRRIEVGLPKELGEDIYTLVEEWDFSAYYLLEIILERKAVYNRYSLAESVIAGLAERGRKKDAEIILRTVQKIAETEGED